MTSSPADRKKVPGWRQPWDPWRILMTSGSIVLLIVAFTQVGGEKRLPEWLAFGLQMLGFVLLGIGFFLAMRQRREASEKRRAEEKQKS